jgi:hypothetical protein
LPDLWKNSGSKSHTPRDDEKLQSCRVLHKPMNIKGFVATFDLGRFELGPRPTSREAEERENKFSKKTKVGRKQENGRLRGPNRESDRGLGEDKDSQEPHP